MSAIVLTASAPAEAQEQDANEFSFGLIDQVSPSARAAVFGVNAGINAIICSTAAAIEKRDFLEDGAKCLLGGSIQSLGMEIGMYNRPIVPGLAMRIVETGTSIIDNTLAGRDIFDRLQYEIGPVLFEIDSTTAEVSAYWRALPIAGIIGNLVLGNQLNIEDTLSYQTFTFNTIKNANINGYTLGNIMSYDPNVSTYVRAHEFNHVLQYVRLRPAEQLFPEFLRFNAHWRIGEDLLTGMIYAPLLLCSAAGKDNCGRRWWNLTEVESYIMETGDGSYVKDASF